MEWAGAVWSERFGSVRLGLSSATLLALVQVGLLTYCKVRVGPMCSVVLLLFSLMSCPVPFARVIPFNFVVLPNISVLVIREADHTLSHKMDPRLILVANLHIMKPFLLVGVGLLRWIALKLQLLFL